MSAAQRKAVTKHRKRLKQRGLVRVEVASPETDVGLIREVARALRGEPTRAAKARERLRAALGPEPTPNLLELLADAADVDLDEYLTRSRDLGRDTAL